MSQYTSITGTAYANVRALKEIHLVLKTVQELAALATLDGLDTRDWSSQTAVTWVLLELSRAAFTTVCTSPSFSVNRTYHVSNNLQWFSGSLYYCCTIFDLFVPDAPVDPAAIQNCATGFWKQQESLLREQIILHSHAEYLTTGNLENIVIDCLREQLEEVLGRLRVIPALPLNSEEKNNIRAREDVYKAEKGNVCSARKTENIIKTGVKAALGAWGGMRESGIAQNGMKTTGIGRQRHEQGKRNDANCSSFSATTRGLEVSIEASIPCWTGTALLNKLNPKYKSMMNEYVNDCGQHIFNCIQDVEFSLEVKGSEKLNEDWISMRPVDGQIKNIEYKIRHTWF
ncbi:hypothetical protein DFH07DRAFT_778351 [Mycena maculata]|uniref:Uncharacterized protein n=1 Tax=Mycena maculata TaxID=230809 RepID=A0AAD7N0W8_9AGAR|nr:hypothetical protein DFH07DRAFT_778351 [Mycena maculata]